MMRLPFKFAANQLATMAFCLLTMSATVLATGDAADPFAARKAGWQKLLDGQKFTFHQDEANLSLSLMQFEGDCQIEMIYDPHESLLLTFKLIHDKKEIATIVGTFDSVFCGKKGVFYFAQPSLGNCGCSVSAFNTVTGEKLWEHKLNAVGEVSHSAYSNQVTINQSVLAGVDDKGTSTLVITGHESYGDYIEVLDEDTGTMLAHTVYRKGF